MVLDMERIKKEFPIGCAVEDCYGQRGLVVIHNSFEAHIDRFRNCVLYGGVYIFDRLTGKFATRIT